MTFAAFFAGALLAPALAFPASPPLLSFSESLDFGHGWTVSHTYDAAGNRASLTTQFGTEAAKLTAFEYDRANRLVKVTSAEGEITTYTYDAAGNRTAAALPNGTTTAWTYDPRNRVTRVEHKKAAAVLAAYTYTWNAQGLRSREDHSIPPMSSACRSDHTYDALGRLTRTVKANNLSACRAVGQWSYAYDAVGNRVSETGDDNNTVNSFSWTHSYNANDRLTATSGTPAAFGVNKAASYEYDANGNVVRKTEPPSFGTPQVSEYTWDAESRLIGALPKIIQGQGNSVVQPKPLSYLYDAEGQLIREVRDVEIGVTPPAANVTLYLPDKNLAFSQILEERDGSGNLRVGYLYADGQPLKQVRGGTSSFYHANHLSVEMLTNALGNAEDMYQYNPFGELTRTQGSGFSGAPTINNVVRFAGERFDPNTGLIYLRARHYDPRSGRFMSADSFSGKGRSPITLNKYLYANANPVRFKDPSGRFSIMDSSIAGNIAVTLSNAQLDFGANFIQARLDGGGSEDSGLGWAIIGALVPSTVKLVTKGLTEIRRGAGWLRFSKKSPPLPKEISAAEYLAEKEGAKIFIRGKGIEGADFLMDGVKWELKTLDAPTNTAVARNIKKATGQSNRVIIDGRAAGLTQEEAIEGIARAARNGSEPSEIMILLGNGSIVRYP